MYTDRCKTAIDEALNVNLDKSKLTNSTLLHLESCSECRRSLNSIKALKTSTASVLPALTNVALKNKIATKLASSIKVSQANLNNSPAAVPTAAVKIIQPILITAITISVLIAAYILNNSNSSASENYNNNKEINVFKSTDQSPIEQQQNISISESANNQSHNSSENEEIDLDLRSNIKKEFPSKTLASPISY